MTPHQAKENWSPFETCLSCTGRKVLRNSNRIVPDTASFIRGWMQMVLTPNDLFSWNNKYSKYTVTSSHLHYNELILYSSAMHINTHSVHAGDLVPWRGRLLPSSLAPSSLTVSHGFSPAMSVANWCSLSLLGGFPPPSPNMAPSSTGSAHTPSSGYKTRIITAMWNYEKDTER